MHSLLPSKVIFLFFSLLLSASIVSFDISADNAQIRGPKNVDIGKQGKQYGPIRESDTLWRIATKLRPNESVSIYQVMQAIFQKNPSSFLDNNINHLKTGAYLRLPSIAEIRTINKEFAQERSELDDELWDKKQKGQLTQPEINLVTKQAENAKTQDVIVAKEELSQEIQQAKVAQQQKLDQLKNEFQSSVNNVEAILNENKKLKQQVVSLSNELQLIRGYLDTDRQTLEELKALLADQHRILADQEAKAKADEESFGLHNLTNNPLLLLLIGLVPGLLIVAGIVYWLRLRNRHPEIEQPPTFDKSDSNTIGSSSYEQVDLSQTQQKPIPQARNESYDVDLEPLANDSLDMTIQSEVPLDDRLDGQEDDIETNTEEEISDNSNGLIGQSDLDNLLDDALDDVLDDELDANQSSDEAFSDNQTDLDDLDSILEQDYELPNEQLDSLIDSDDISTDTEIALDIPEEQEPDSGEITNFADVDAIMDELSDEMPTSDTETTEINLDMDDIDAMIDEIESEDNDFSDLNELLEKASIDGDAFPQDLQESVFDETPEPQEDYDFLSDEDLTFDNSSISNNAQTNEELSNFEADTIDEEDYVDNSLGDPLFETTYQPTEPEKISVETTQPSLDELDLDFTALLTDDDTAEQQDDSDEIELDTIELDDIELDDIDLNDNKSLTTNESDELSSTTSVDGENYHSTEELNITDIDDFNEDVSEQVSAVKSVDEDSITNIEDSVNEQSVSADEPVSNELNAYNEVDALDETNDDLLKEIETTDFDSLLNELAETESSNKHQAVDISSDLSPEQKSTVDLPASNKVDVNQQDYLDIDTLLEQSDDDLLEEEPYNNIDMNVGLGDFDDLLAGDDPLDVDAENQGFSAKLDLAKAYLEINDSESALKVIDDVIENGPSEVQNEAQTIKEQLEES